jgi:hypothetical protein
MVPIVQCSKVAFANPDASLENNEFQRLMPKSHDALQQRYLTFTLL